MKLEADKARCDGFRLCAEAAPDLVRHDDEGYPIAVAVSEKAQQLAAAAADACPVAALLLLQVDA